MPETRPFDSAIMIALEQFEAAEANLVKSERLLASRPGITAEFSVRGR